MKNKSGNEEVKVRSKKRKKGRGFKIGIILTSIMGVLLLSYGGASAYFINHFFFGSEINGKDYSRKSVEEVEKSMKTDIASYELTLTKRDNQTEIITAADIGLEYVNDGKIRKLKEEQKPFAWIAALFNAKSYQMKATVKYDEAKLVEVIKGLECFQEENITDPVNANVEYDGNQYVIKEEVMGNRLNEETVINLVTQAVTDGNAHIMLEEQKCYQDPVYKKDSEQVVQLRDTFNQYLGVTITYDFGDRKEVVDKSVFQPWLTVGEEMQPQFNDDMVNAYIKKLSQTYSTVGGTRSFASSRGTTVEVKGGTYGWRINRPEEVEDLKRVITEGKSITKEPIYSNKAAQRGINDVGNSYIEIDMTAQRMWFYKDGNVIVDTPIVTGNMSKGYGTPGGTYFLAYKQRNAILKGENYRTPVDFWMPFNNGIGIHDANWRDKFGGEIYKTGGSHGCINTPPENAKVIYDNIEKGMPIICYY